MKGKSELVQARRVALYARVSSDRQAQEGTIDSQVSAIRARIDAEREMLEAEMVFCDDGVSGATLVRPALERLRDQAASGAVDRLYLLAPDRLARRHAHQMVLLEEFEGHGVEVVFVNRPLGTTLGATAEDQLLLQVQGVVAEYERAKILERTRRGRLHAARCGRVSVLGRSAYGYRYIDKHAGCGTASYEVLPEEARVVRQMFDWVGREGCSLAEVVRRLERLGVPTRSGRKRWDRSTIWGMLGNPAYRGAAAYGKTRRGERQCGPHSRLRPLRGQPEVPKQPYSTRRQPATEHIAIAVPALVDAELFAAVQERLEENRRRLRQHRRGARFLLQGLVMCGCCGYALVGRGGGRGGGRGSGRGGGGGSGGGSGGGDHGGGDHGGGDHGGGDHGGGDHGERSYYRCLGTDGYRFGGEPVCRNRMQRVEDMDAAVWTDVCALLSEPDRLREEFERRRQRTAVELGTAEEESLRKAIAKVRQGISRLLDAYTEGLVGRDEFQPRMERLQDRLGRLLEDQRILSDRRARDEEFRQVLDHVHQFADQVKAGLATATWETRREVVRALVKRVEVGNDTIEIVYKVPPCPFDEAPERGSLQHCWSRQAVAMAHPSG